LKRSPPTWPLFGHRPWSTCHRDKAQRACPSIAPASTAAILTEIWLPPRNDPQWCD
jgi:hypothetical protein